jgi:hypothetical protein
VTYQGPAPSEIAEVSQISFQIGSFPSNGAIYLNQGSTLSPGFAIHVVGQ